MTALEYLSNTINHHFRIEIYTYVYMRVHQKSRSSWRSLDEVSLVGLRAALDPQSPPPRRVLWTIVLAVCSVLMCIQCVDRVRRFNEEPVRVHVKVTPNDSLEYPAVTVCPDAEFANKLNFTAMEPRHMLGTGSNFSCWFGRGLRCTKRGSWSPVETVIGRCLTFTLEEKSVSEAGGFHNLFLRMFAFPHAEPPGIIVHVHERHQPPVFTVFFHGIVIAKGWSREIKVEMRQFRLLNTRKAPCCADPDYSDEYCRILCVSRLVVKTLGCRLLFMPAEIPGDECSGREKELGMNMTNDLLTSGGWSWNCSCLKPCRQTAFYTYPETTSFMPNQLKTRVYFETLVYEQVSEELAYPVISLLCDIGSTLSLLVGASLLTVCELIEVAMSRLATSRASFFLRPRLPSPVAPKPISDLPQVDS